MGNFGDLSLSLTQLVSESLLSKATVGTKQLVCPGADLTP